MSITQHTSKGVLLVCAASGGGKIETKTKSVPGAVPKQMEALETVGGIAEAGVVLVFLLLLAAYA